MKKEIINCYACKRLIPDYLAYFVKLSFAKRHENICHICNNHNRKGHTFVKETGKWVTPPKKYYYANKNYPHKTFA